MKLSLFVVVALVAMSAGAETQQTPPAATNAQHTQTQPALPVQSLSLPSSDAYAPKVGPCLPGQGAQSFGSTGSVGASY